MHEWLLQSMAHGLGPSNGGHCEGKQGVMLCYKAIVHKIGQHIKAPLIFTFA